MMTPPPINDELEEEEEIKRRSFNWRVRIEQRALGFAASGADGLPKHQGGRFAYQLRDEQRLKNIAGVPQAIVKVIPGGGVGSRGELVAQLNYLSRDGTQELEQGGGPGGYQIEGQDAIRDVATDWAMAWEDAASRDGRTARAKSKSFHLLVSYPEGTDPDMAQMAAEAFTDQLCQSGEYGDRWRYIAAWHTDRAHPHMHVVIDRLGASGRMMQIHPAKTINPKALRALQVDTAIEYGIALNDTPRVSRGHRDRGLSSPEWRAEQRNERRERSPTRQVYAKTASDFAEDAIGREANELKKLSERYQRADTPERRKEAKALEQAAFILSSGGTLDENTHVIAKKRQPYKSREDHERREGSLEREVSVSDNVETAIRRHHSTSKDATSDAFTDLVAQMRTETRDHSKTEPQPTHTPRRMTEAELRDHLIAEERKITERQRRVEGRSQITVDDSSSESESPDQSISEPDEVTYLHQRPQLNRSRQDEARQPKRLTEKELSEQLNQRVKEMNEAEKRQERDRPRKPKNRGMDFGFN